ncbi:MAG: PAS domain-containing protein, partial [Desulfovibrionales bacterium]|nr:PAS domain-containing protein [Desulfovibrionales bacterium]
MKYYIGFIGPGRLLSQTVRKLSDVAGINIPGTVAGVCVTNKEGFELDLPVYSHWHELVLDCNLDFLIVLSDDSELKQDIRRNLSLDVELVEYVPAMIGISDLIASSIFRKKLSKKNKFLDSFIESIPFPVLAFNHNGFVTHWNSNCEKFTKVMAQNVLGKKDVGDVFFQDKRPLLGQMLLNDYSLSNYRQFFPDPDLEIVLKKDSVMIKGFLIFKGAIQGYFQITSQKIFLDDKVIGSIELIQDLNALTFLQEEATKKQAALHSIVSHLPFPMIQSSLNGDIIFSNKAGSEFLEQMIEQAQSTS